MDLVVMYVLTIGFFTKKSILRKELDNEQKTTDNSLSIINYMLRNSNEPSNNFYKTTNAQIVQINALTRERRFQTQN